MYFEKMCLCILKIDKSDESKFFYFIPSGMVDRGDLEGGEERQWK